MKREKRIRRLAPLIVLAVFMALAQPILKQTVPMQEQTGQSHKERESREEQEAPEQYQTEQEIQELVKKRIEKSCVRIQAGEHYGSGCIYDITRQRILVVTNRHVLESWDEESYVNLFDGTPCRGEVVALSEDADIGFLSIRASSVEECVKRELESIQITGVICETGDDFYMLDMASDVYDKKLYQGQILEEKRYLAEFGMEMLYGESCFVEGMSGCGLFDLQGNYIGMLTGGTKQNEIAAILSEAIESLAEQSDL